MSGFYGRERELAWSLSRLEATGAHGTGLVVVSGPAGVGKTRFVGELREHARLAGFPVLEGWCVRAAAFAPFANIASQGLTWLRSRGDRELLAPGDVDALAPLVSGRAPRDEPDDDEGAMRFVEAVGRLLAAVGRQRPVLVLLRGWERADDASRALVRSLLDSAGPIGEPTPGAPAALLLVTSRSGAVTELAEHPRAASVSLEGLELDAVRKLVSDERFVARLHASTGGNPEALWGVLERPSTPRASEVLSRVGQLGALQRRILAVLGLVGRPLPVGILAVAVETDLQTTARAIPVLIDAGLVWRDLDPSVGDVVLGLVHAEDGDATAAGLQEEERRLVEQSLGNALEGWGRAPPEEVLEHLLAGTNPAQVAPRATEVAQSLLRRHAPSRALALLTAAARFATAEVLARFAPLASSAARSSGNFADARALLARAVKENPTAPELLRLDAALALAVGDLDACAAMLSAAEVHVNEPGGDAEAETAMRGRIAAVRAELCYQRGELEDAEAVGRQAIVWSKEEDPLHSQARNTLTKVYLWRGELERGVEWTNENIARARARGATTEVLRGVINLGVIAVRRGALEEAVRHFENARTIATRGGSMMLRGVLKENEAVVAHLRGRFGEALTLYQEALGILIRVGNRQFLARVANNHGELYVQVGETVRARNLFDYASQVGRGLSRGVTAEGLLLRAQVDLLEGRGDAARGALSEALAIFAASGERGREAEAQLLLARAWLDDGDTARAEQALSVLPEQEEVVGLRLLAERTRIDAELRRAQGHDSWTVARRALELAERAGDEDLLLRAQVLLALGALDRGDEAAARKHTEAAQALREELLSRVPEGLRSGYDTVLGRTGLLELVERLRVAAESARARTRVLESVPPPKVHERGGLLGDSPAMEGVRRMISRVGPMNTTVLVLGESGTGKERVAEAIHRASSRRDGPWVAVNCGAIAETLLHSELFGHEPGSFTGANRRRKGRFEQADGGTIFLDEVGELSPAMQTALLRVLQERTFERVGGNTPIKVDVRVLAATNKDLEAGIRTGSFREDLYYRLAGILIKLPPLRERIEDLPVLSLHLLEQTAREEGLPNKRLTPAALRKLSEHHWQGNVRELGNVLRKALVLAEGNELTPDDIDLGPVEPRMTEWRGSVPPPAPEKNEVEVVYDRIRGKGISLFDMRKELEKGCIARALEESGGNITRAAALLGMKRPRLSQLVREYGLAKGSDPDENLDS